MAKKPAQLSENLLNLRPRKGEARPQSEAEATPTPAPAPIPNPEVKAESAAPRRRRRRSQNTEQLNLRVTSKTLERFTALADKENVIFGDLLEKLLNHYEKR